MTSEELRRTRDAFPFQPFIIHVTDGRTFRIHHRDYLSMSPVGRTVIVYDQGGAFDILDIMLITGLSVEAGAAATSQETSAE